MRFYAMMTTASMNMLIAAYVLVEYTQMEFIGMVFMDIMIGLFSMLLFAIVTEPPKKKKAHWEKSGDLEVMVMNKRR